MQADRLREISQWVKALTNKLDEFDQGIHTKILMCLFSYF